MLKRFRNDRTYCYTTEVINSDRFTISIGFIFQYRNSEGLPKTRGHMPINKHDVK